MTPPSRLAEPVSAPAASDAGVLPCRSERGRRPRDRRTWTAAVALALALVACGGEQAERVERVREDRMYAEAERAWSRGDPQAAELFRAFAERATDPEDRAVALFRLAEIDEAEGRLDAAEAGYRQVAQSGIYERQALAELRIALIALEKRGDRAGGAAAMRALVERYPESAAADKALRYLAVAMADRRAPDPAEDRALVGWLQGVVAQHPDSAVADNAQWWTAWVQVYRIGDLGAARRSLRAFVQRWPMSPLLDPVVNTLGALYQRLGEWQLAADAFQTQMRIYDTATYVIGRYRTPALDDAALMVGEIEYHGVQDLNAAEAAYRRLLDEFPTSVKRDDAWWGIANVRLERGDRPGAEAALRSLLAERPDSRFAERARGLLAGGDGPDLRDRPDPAKVRSPLLAPDASGNL
jgi:TolA-binding protein